MTMVNGTSLAESDDVSRAMVFAFEAVNRNLPFMQALIQREFQATGTLLACALCVDCRVLIAPATNKQIKR